MADEFSWLAFAVPIAIGKKVTGSTPVTSTKSGSFRIFFIMTYFVYIIFSQQLDKYYVGHTADLSKRVDQHNSGISSFTSKASDWVLKYSESFSDRMTALAREKEIKNKKSRRYIEWLMSSAG